MPLPTVQARERPGSGSRELTIPAEYRDEFDVQQGDVFQVEANEDENGDLVIKYTRVYTQPSEE